MLRGGTPARGFPYPTDPPALESISLAPCRSKSLCAAFSSTLCPKAWLRSDTTAFSVPASGLNWRRSGVYWGSQRPSHKQNPVIASQRHKPHLLPKPGLFSVPPALNQCGCLVSSNQRAALRQRANRPMSLMIKAKVDRHQPQTSSLARNVNDLAMAGDRKSYPFKDFR
jgi:hypothetical protein